MLSHHADLKHALAHVLWLGGAPDAGKTTVARLLVQKHALQEYHFDQWELVHFARLDPERHPGLYTVSPEKMTLDERWVLRPVELMVQQVIQAWTERFGMVIDDLLAMPTTPMIVAEGPGLFPACVASLLSNPRQALWLVPTEAFKRASAMHRSKLTAFNQTSDPGRAQRNWFVRDMQLVRYIKEQAQALGLPLLEVDGAQSIDEIAAVVEHHFEPLLPET